MKTTIAIALACALIGGVHAADSTITPKIQTIIDAHKKVIAEWAAEPVLVAAVKAQNEKGPLPGMTNPTWIAAKADDPAVEAFQKNDAGLWLAGKLKASNGLFTEAFLSAAKGELVAFVEKPTRYLHARMSKFEVPMRGEQWQGAPEMDESINGYEVQISTPVLDEGKPIGALVVGISMAKLSAE